MRRKFTAALGLLSILSACGGGGGGGSPPAPPTVGLPAPAPAPGPVAGCTLAERQNWVAAQLNEWYLFPETLPTGLNPANYTSVQAYIDALTATARSQGRDRYFTYITSIAEENAFYNSGSNAGFGIRLATDVAAQRVLISEAFEGAPALAAGIDRGTEILAIGTSSANLQTVASIIAAQGSAGITAALGPSDPGVTRVLRIRDAAGTRDVTVTKADYSLTPVSSRYGARIIDDGGRRVGYLNFRTFINTADPALRNAFAYFKAQGVTDIIVDLRYNGGGLVAIAELMGDLLGGGRTTNDVFSITAFRASKSQYNESRNFSPQPESINPTRIAFIGTGGSASASELVMNAFIPYYPARTALVGTNTYGKPVGQIGLDRAQCDDRLRVVAFATQNRDGQGAYYQGLASFMPATCEATDDLTRPLGDPAEASVARALDFLAQRPCSPIRTASAARGVAPRQLLTPLAPTAAQREVPGLF